MAENWKTINGNHVLLEEKEDKKDLSYQGIGSASDKPKPTGKTADTVINEIRRWEEEGRNSSVIESNKESIETLKSIENNPDAKIKIYRATLGDSINDGDWVFIERENAERWTKSPFGSPKPGYKVVELETQAKNVEWAGKNLEFAYRENGVEERDY